MPFMPHPSSARRTVRLIRSPSLDGVGVFEVTERKKSSHYAFHEVPCEIGGRGFAVHRLGLGPLYHVRIGRPMECSCECLGFLRHDHCKHIEALQTLIGETHL
jgi:hypothetical protein